MVIPRNCVFGENVAHNAFIIFEVRGAVISAIVKQRRVAVSVTITIVTIPVSVAGVIGRIGIVGRVRILRIFVRSVWVVAPVPSPPRTPWKAEVADDDDFIEMVEATKPIISIKVAVDETLNHWKRRCIHHSDRDRIGGRACESAAHSDPGYRITVPLDLRGRSRGCENTCYHAIKENEFSPVHSVIRFQRLKPPVFESCGTGKDKT